LLEQRNELGVGLGSMTLPLAKRVAKVIGIEIDAGIVQWHQDENILPDNVTLIHQDLLKSDFTEIGKQCGGKIKIIANLPYSISNPFLFKLIKHSDIVDYAVIMLQKEVGMRLVASAGTKEYGVLSVLTGAVASVEKIMSLGPQYFHPKPKVDSVVIKITFNPKPDRVKKLQKHDSVLLKKIVKSAFQQRRKTLLNALSSSDTLLGSKAEVKNHIEAAGLSPSVRPDKLTIDDYVSLANQAVQRKK